MSLKPLPIDPLLPDVVRVLDAKGVVVLEAPPGAGKTTRIPRALLDAWPSGEIVVLEPRRLAARMAANRVAEELGEKTGERIGYQVRFEEVASAKTRVRFVTEAILTRRLVRDPKLEGVACVLLDEFHERHLHGDVALAWLRRLRETSRPDLKLAVMSATLDTAKVAAYLACETLRSEGKRFDVAIEHLPAPEDRPIASLVASAVRSLLQKNREGDVLVFLPGAREIRESAESLDKIAKEHDLAIFPLHGDLPAHEQDRAIKPSSQRKIILSTNVAESSVTIDGVVAVIDSGLARAASHDPWSGFSKIELAKISRASATQRAGRAGRTRPGVCLRLYTKGDLDRRPEHDAPEIAKADLTQLALDLASADMTNLDWLDAPPDTAWTAATSLLARLGALANGKVTALGRSLLRFPAHPRLARLLVEGEARGVASEACVLAAILMERDLRIEARARFGASRAADRPTERSDLLALLDLFEEAKSSHFSGGSLRASGLDSGAVHAVERARKQLEGRVKKNETRGSDEDLLRSVLAGFPDHVAKRLRSGARALALSGGGSAELSESSVVREAEWMVAASAETRRGLVVQIASAIEPEWLLDLAPDRIEEIRSVAFDDKTEKVEAKSLLRYDGLTLTESPAANVTEEEVARALAKAAMARGKAFFAADDDLDRFMKRAKFAASIDERVKAPDDALLETALATACWGKRSFAELRNISIADAVANELGPGAAARIAELAPEKITLQGGRTTKIVYGETAPYVASRLQDFFGMKATPRIGGGKTPLVLHLLAPNGRAVQVTTDLAGFWERHYPAIRKELGRKYPRHKWPESPV
ncbi:MAG: ATP-dependent helicase HrpB [Polyangiaceae bacterium]